MMLESILAQITTGQVAIAFVSFMAGFLVRTFVFTAKERADYRQDNFVNAKEFAAAQQTAFNDLMIAFETYATTDGKPTVKEFAAISRAAQNYLYQQQLTADAILSGKVDPVSRDNTLMPKLIETTERVIPRIYETLHKIAQRNSLDYPIEFKRENYESIYAAVEKYGSAVRRSATPPAANSPPTGG
jgi:hypothetical protein